ncbi:MAG: glycosyltransferase family 9 protein [Bacteroidales bacterium]
MEQRFLVIQTAFIGDAILATALLEELQLNFPGAKLDLLVRKGNQGLFEGHPYIHTLFVWDKSGNKIASLSRLIRQIRGFKYDRLINLHRFASSGVISCCAKAKVKAGFDKNPFSSVYDVKIAHRIGEDQKHEVDRNARLIEDITKIRVKQPKLYPLEKHIKNVSGYKTKDYICIAPASVWFTKQFPGRKWIEFLDQIDPGYKVYLLGALSDFDQCEHIRTSVNGLTIENLAGKLNLLETAALMKDARMNYVNDSAPLHLASAVNAPVTAIFCSTVPAFGFGPLSEQSKVVEVQEPLSCRPCGLHGYRKCPEKHFMCAENISVAQLVKQLSPERIE